MSPPANLGIATPASWYELDLHAATRRASIGRIVDESAYRLDPDGALFAAVFWEPGEYGPIAANLMVFEGLRSLPDSIGAEVATALRDLAEPNPHDYGPREVSEVSLSIGPAARVRFLTSSPPDRKHSAAALVLDATQVWIPLAGRPPMVIVSGATPCLIAGDDVAAVVDGVAASLRYV